MKTGPYDSKFFYFRFFLMQNVNSPAREFSLIWTLPKWISFSRMDGKVYSVISKAENYESEVRISKFKMADPIWRSRIQYFNEFWILNFAVIDLKTLTRGFLELVMTILKSEFKN